jgi:DNA (cytosine-5)-methyltransferase 1
MAVTAMGPKRKADRELKVASACSGMGTESFALKQMQVPHRLVLACEIQKTMREFLQRNHEPQTLLPDCTSPGFLRAGVGAELFVAGFPCQTFSGAGRNAGMEDPRGRVIISLIKWLRAHQPHAFILENVQGLVHRHPKVFRAIVRKLEGILDMDTNKGCYRITWAIMNSRDHGVPQAPL